MKPYYTDDYCQIFHGDCREILPGLEKVDLCLTDPPYGIGRIMQGGKGTGDWNHLSGGNAWDREAPSLGFLMQAADSFVIWGGNYFPLPPSRGWLSWFKPDRVPSAADVEMCWTSRDMNARQISHSIAATNGTALRQAKVFSGSYIT